MYQCDMHGKIAYYIKEKTYYYDAVAIVLTDRQEHVDVSINLHPTNTACDPRCEEPSLNSYIRAYLSPKEAHITISFTHSAILSSTSSDSTTDLVYRVRRDPVAYLRTVC